MWPTLEVGSWLNSTFGLAVQVDRQGFTTFAAFCKDPAVAVVVLCNTGPDGLEDGQVIDKLGEKLIRQLVTAGSKAND